MDGSPDNEGKQSQMKPEELNIIVRKVEELRALMVFTQRTIPFLDDVFEFVKDIVPLLDVLKSSVETTSEKLPTGVQAAGQDHDGDRTGIDGDHEHRRRHVSEGRPDACGAERSHCRRGCRQRNDGAAVCAVGRDPGCGQKRTRSAPTPRSCWMVWCRPVDAVQEVESIQADCTNIMIALQVQDITAQQIAAVNKLMQSVDEGLNRLLKHFSKSTAEHDEVTLQAPQAGHRLRCVCGV